GDRGDFRGPLARPLARRRHATFIAALAIGAAGGRRRRRGSGDFRIRQLLLHAMALSSDSHRGGNGGPRPAVVGAVGGRQRVRGGVSRLSFRRAGVDPALPSLATALCSNGVRRGCLADSRRLSFPGGSGAGADGGAGGKRAFQPDLNGPRGRINRPVDIPCDGVWLERSVVGAARSADSNLCTNVNGRSGTGSQGLKL